MISEKLALALVDFISDFGSGIDLEWVMQQTNIEFLDFRTIHITIDDINWQEYGWLKEAADIPKKVTE